MINKIKKIVRSITQNNIYGFISPSINIEPRKGEFESLINNPDNKYVEQFEQAVSKYIGKGTAITFASGRMAFWALLKYLGVTYGDEVALTGFTCAVMSNAVMRIGATPIYVDIDKDSLGMSPIDLERKITSKTKVIVAQHSFGLPCEIDRIKDIAHRNHSFLIEDCALTLGSKYKGIICGNWGDAAFFSTDHTKPLNTLIGGFVYTNNDSVSYGVRSIRDAGYNLTVEHQRLILEWYIKEYNIERSNHKKYVINDYWRAFKHKLHLSIEPLPYLSQDASSCTNDNNIYGYPSKYPPFLAKIGLEILPKYIASIKERIQWKSDLLNIIRKYEYSIIPSAYDNENNYIIPLRIVFLTKHKRRDFSYIDDWIWFKKPIEGTNEALSNFGYKDGLCPISEYVGENIMNYPIILDMDMQRRFLKKINKTMSKY